MIYASQITMLYTLNAHSAACQLYLNKTGKKKEFLQRIETIFFKMEILKPILRIQRIGLQRTRHS